MSSVDFPREAAEMVAKWRNEGDRIVFTNGVFDLLHAGHVMYLNKAKQFGERLVVGLNADASVRRLNKGPGRPLNGQADRQTVLEALKSVDLVVVFDEDTPAELIEIIRPDVLVKGGDYDDSLTDSNAPGYIVGSAEVRRWGGDVKVVPLLPGRSTTNLIQKSRK